MTYVHGHESNFMAQCHNLHTKLVPSQFEEAMRPLPWILFLDLALHSSRPHMTQNPSAKPLLLLKRPSARHCCAPLMCNFW